MPKFIISLIFIFFLSWPAYGQVSYYEALQFAQQYEREVGGQPSFVSGAQEVALWKLEAEMKSGVAYYEESESNLDSEWDALYAEIELMLSRDFPNDIQVTLAASYAQSIGDEEEAWDVGGRRFQTNDMEFFRTNLQGTLGKILYSERYKELRVIPFLGYGFRYIDFERTNFNILNTITSTSVVDEEYYIRRATADRPDVILRTHLTVE